MGTYIPDTLRFSASSRGDPREAMRAVTSRYVGEHPITAPFFRPSSAAGILRGSDFRYLFDFEAVYPLAPNGSIAYAWGELALEQGRQAPFAVSLFGPARLFVDGRQAFKSHIGHERSRELSHGIDLALEAGRHVFVLEFEKTPAGFGGVFGTANPKSAQFNFLSPSMEAMGFEGWLYSMPLARRLDPIPVLGQSEASTGIEWHPKRSWTARESGQGRYRRMFGFRPGFRAYGWAKAFFPSDGTYRFRGSHAGHMTIAVGGVEVVSEDGDGEFSVQARIPYGAADVVVGSSCGTRDWDWSLSIDGPDGPVPLRSPVRILGWSDPWLHAGPFGKESTVGPGEIARTSATASPEGAAFRLLDGPGLYARPFVEGGNFGQWSYPLGVTLYGLMRAGRALAQPDLIDYAKACLGFAVEWYPVMREDAAHFGAPTILPLLFTMNCLDDCGSAGSALLEAALQEGLPGFERLASDIAFYVRERQERLPDRAFMRDNPKIPFMVKTLWVDDLYMSVPFMARYAQVSKDPTWLDDAALQFLRYREYLFIPEKRIMSHVYDVKAKMATGVAWGRGNGWALFSLAELLSFMPEGHRDREALLDFFRSLSSGYLALQDPKGMWHQVLTDHSSYPEASCTAMFVYAFARGVRSGWLGAEYRRAADAGWEALEATAVDKRGNVYGVCRGSGFSFTERYYRDELSWNLNDTHGIGIVLLAGAEIAALHDANSGPSRGNGETRG